MDCQRSNNYVTLIPEFVPLSLSILAKLGNLITNFQIPFDQCNHTNLSKIAKEEMFFN